MSNQKGMGLLGLLISVLIMTLLLSVVLKRYAGQTRRALHLQGIADPALTGRSRSLQKESEPASKVPPCNGRLVGNICVPTEARSSSLDAFEQMNK